ncbi:MULTISPECIES: NAD+ synthase [Halomicrobium]|uniref:NH(3)-dependent NAD(+) synthetase n=2 Tax=Halomicrobium mukohataei TaxID=57705 RepID=C7P258_HALMD|nr:MULTISPECIES: NAD+ synthase [Halomicrobium]ACV47287.1 NAD+ synthetase [Halomicrobium mukohataei DSM 12286]QCD65757.1 NAD+ synthase [Halomicrobium mukohataei]QFR20562.1 NAD+ synthase [Halomicrobium sp. ZPS1]
MAEAKPVQRADDPLDLTLSEAELEAYRDHITDFIAEQADAAGVETAIIGLSGGIDSTLTSHLAVEALGAANVYGLVMPSEVNREANMSDAERVASELLDIEYDVIEVEPIADAFLDGYPDAEGDQLAVGNLRVRCRAVLNYLAANHRDSIVLGTGNRSEALVGYFTKYGDGAVDCHPIANLYKGQVRQLATHVGVPDDLAEKTASAEMWLDQTDEAELGIDYPTLDSILALHVEGGVSASATAAEIGVDEDAVEHVRTLYEGSEHKRAAPPGPDPLF